MSSRTLPSETRYRQIQKRQSPPRWGRDYVPAILATREEAPAGSRPCKIWSDKFGRDLHTLSSIERDVILIALYHPKLFEVHEQRVLSCTPCDHPLQSHPKFPARIWPSLRGTVKVAESLHVLEFHPTFSIENPKEPGSRVEAPFPWIGDFLLFLEDAAGPYCVNWTIKASAEQFEKPLRLGRRPKNMERAIAKERARHMVEEIYYQDGGIRTQRITGAQYSQDLAANLIQIYSWHARPIPFSENQRKNILDHFKAEMVVGEPPIATMLKLMAYERYDLQDLKSVFYQAIWHRELRPDLFQPLLIDRPVQPEKRDVLSEYEHWFARD